MTDERMLEEERRSIYSGFKRTAGIGAVMTGSFSPDVSVARLVDRPNRSTK